jgi:hypothetical protein
LPDNRNADIEDADWDPFDPEDNEGEYFIHKPPHRDFSYLIDRR